MSSDRHCRKTMKGSVILWHIQVIECDWFPERWWAESDLWPDTCWHLRWEGRGCGTVSRGSRLLHIWWWWCNVPPCLVRRTPCTSHLCCLECSPSWVFPLDPGETQTGIQWCVNMFKVQYCAKVLAISGLLQNGPLMLTATIWLWRSAILYLLNIVWHIPILQPACRFISCQLYSNIS